MTAVNAKEITDPARIIDVRTPDEYLQEHIPGSRNIPMDQIGIQAAQFKEQPVILSCRTGRRASEAKVFLEAQGCTQVTVLEGGLQGWKAAGKPTQTFKKGYTIMQQVQIIAGSMILIGSFFKPFWFLAPLAGFGLLMAGLTNTCLMASLLSKVPWNRLPDHTSESCSTGNCSL